MIDAEHVPDAEIARDVHAGRAGHTVAAAGAGVLNAGLQRLHRCVQRRALGLGERLKVAEGGDVVHHLRRVGHPAEDDLHVRQRADEAHRPRRVRLPGRDRRQARRDVRRQLRQQTALDRLHHDDGNALFGRQPIALQPRLRLGVHIVDLKLAEIPVARAEDGAEHVEAVVEREAEMADFSGPLHPFAEFHRAEFLQFLPLGCVERVQQIEVYVVGAQPRELLVEHALDVGGRLQRPRGQLGRQKIRVPRVFRQRFAQKRFALPVVVGVGRVQIVDAVLHRQRQQRACRRAVDLPVFVGGETHTAEAQQRRIDAEVFHAAVFHFHRILSFFLVRWIQPAAMAAGFGFGGGGGENLTRLFVKPAPRFAAVFAQAGTCAALPDAALPRVCRAQGGAAVFKTVNLGRMSRMMGRMGRPYGGAAPPVPHAFAPGTAAGTSAPR